MKLEKNKSKSITIRINEEDLRYLNAVSFMAGMSVSKFVRTMIDSSINGAKIAVNQGKVKLEDIETLRNDKL